MRAWVEASCAAQGVPVKVSDVGALAGVAGLLGATSRPKDGGAPNCPAIGSDAPDRLESGRVEAVVAATSGIHDDELNDGGDDCLLAAEAETFPSLPERASSADMPIERARS